MSTCRSSTAPTGAARSVAVHRACRPHPHDGRRPAVHLGRNQQDHQPAQRRHGRRHQGCVPAELGTRHQGERPLPRRLQAQPAAQLRRATPIRSSRTRKTRKPSRLPAKNSPKRPCRAAEAVSERQVEVVREVVERIVDRPLRRRLPDTRSSMTHKFNVAGHEGTSPSGCTRRQAGRAVHHHGQGRLDDRRADGLAGHGDQRRAAVRRAARAGWSASSPTSGSSPRGHDHEHEDIPFAKSLVDYIFRWMGGAALRCMRRDYMNCGNSLGCS
jgi:hypothetical protein